MEIVKSFGTKLQNLRKQQGISQERLAELSGLHRTYISSLERGKRNPTLTTLSAIATALNVDMSYLVTGISDE